MNDDYIGFDDEPFAAEPPFPWPPAEGESVPGAFAATWKGAALEPRGFYRALPEQASLLPALAYYLPIGIAVAGAQLFWRMLRPAVDAERDVVLGGADLLGNFSPIVEFLLSPLILLLSLFVSAGVTHLLLRVFGGAHRGYGFTTRVFAYAYSPQILGVVPVIGSIVGFFWMVVVAIIGLREGHRTTTGRAVAAVMIPVVIALVFMALATLLALTGALTLPQP